MDKTELMQMFLKLCDDNIECWMSPLGMEMYHKLLEYRFEKMESEINRKLYKFLFAKRRVDLLSNSIDIVTLFRLLTEEGTEILMTEEGWAEYERLTTSPYLPTDDVQEVDGMTALRLA